MSLTYIRNNRLTTAAFVKVVIMNIAHSVEGIVAFSYFISTYYTEQAIEETKTPQNDTLYYLFKKFYSNTRKKFINKVNNLS